MYQYWFVSCDTCITLMEDAKREMGVKYIEAFSTFSIIQTFPKIEKKSESVIKGSSGIVCNIPKPLGLPSYTATKNKRPCFKQSERQKTGS